MSTATQSSATPTPTLTFAQIMNLQHSPGIHHIRLGPMDINRNFLIDTSLVFEAGSPAPFHPLSKHKNMNVNKQGYYVEREKFAHLKSLHLDNVNYNYIPIFEKMGPIPTLEELTLDLGTPSTELYPVYPTQQGSESSHPIRHTELLFWYSKGIAQGIHALVGKDSKIKSLTLTGFHAYKCAHLPDNNNSGSGNGNGEYDLLGHLLNPAYFTHLEHLYLAGFSPSPTSAFWSTIQLNEDDSGGSIAQRKLPLRSLTLAMKVCREDLGPSTLHADTLDGVEAISKLFRAPSSHFNSSLKASIHLEDGSYYTLFNARDHVELFTGQNHVATSDNDSQPTQVFRW